MPKHSQTKTLGQLTDFSERPEDPLEVRVRNLERAVNEMLLQLADISERLDQPVRNQGFQRGTSKPTQRVSPKPSKKPNPEPKPPKPKSPKPTPPAPEEKMQPAEVAALADAIFQLLSDGTPRPKKAIMKAVGCLPSEYQQARLRLIETGRMPEGTANEIVAGKICNVPGGLAIWTQEQVDAELNRRESKVDANDTAATAGDETAAAREK